MIKTLDARLTNNITVKFVCYMQPIMFQILS